MRRRVAGENYDRLHMYLNVAFADCDLRHASGDHEPREWMRILVFRLPEHVIAVTLGCAPGEYDSIQPALQPALE